MWSPRLLFCLFALAALGLSVLAPVLRAQAALSIRFEEQYYAVSTSAQETRVFFASNIIVSNSAAEVTCDFESGDFFPRGGTEVTCTATLGNQQATGSFVILVSGNTGSDTDAQLFLISQTPAVVRTNSTILYNVEVRVNGLRRADEVIVRGTVPADLELIRSDIRCDVTNLPDMICSLPDVRPGFPVAFVQEMRPKAGFTGTVTFTMEASLGGDAEDLFPANNSFTMTTDVLPALATPTPIPTPAPAPRPDNTIFLPMLRR
jgi:hypothetical protein